MAKRGRKESASSRAVDTLSGDVCAIVLHPKQQEFTYSPAKMRGFCAGISSGKTYCGAYDLLRRAEPGRLYMVVSATYKMLSDSTLRVFIEVATKLGLWDDNNYRRTDNQVILTNGAEVLFRSGDEPGKLRGATLSGVWMDECSQMKEEVFNVLIGRLREGGRLGWLSGTFTPAGKEHWTYRVFGDTSNPNVALFNCSTKDNPFVESAFYDTLLLQYGKGEGGQLRAAQELEGQFVCVEGAEWGGENFGPSIWFDDWPKDPEAIRVVMLDSSKGVGGKSGDYSSFCMMMYAHGLLWVDFDVDNARNTSTMAETAIEIQLRFKPQFFGLESEFGGAVLADDIEQRAQSRNVLMPIVMVPTLNVPKEVRIRRLTPYITRGMVRFKNTDGSKLAVVQASVFPHGQHDDMLDSMEGACRIVNESGVLEACAT